MVTPDAQAAEGEALPRGATGSRRLLAQARFWLAFTLVAVGLVFWTRAGFAIPPNTIAAGAFPLVLAMVSALGYASMGLLLSLRRPEVRIGAIEAWVGVAIGGLAMTWSYLALATSPIGAGADAAPYVALGAAVLITPLIAALAVALVLLFPTDHLLSPAWRRVMWLAAIGALVAGIGRLVRPGALTFVGDYDNPIGITSLGVIPTLAQTGGYLALGVAAVLGGVSVVRRYVAGDRIERAQLRVFAAVTGIGAVAFVLFVGTFLLPPSATGIRDAIVVLNLLVVAVGPFVLALAIARYRLWQMDRLVERTFVYGVLTAILAGLYAASIRLLQSVFVFATGESSEAALVITTLILATTFTPIKNRLDKLAANLTRDPSKAPADATPPPPAGLSAELMNDPEFAAALDAHIRAVMQTGPPAPPASAPPASPPA